MHFGEMGALIVVDRQKAISKIIKAFIAAKGNRTETARILEANRRNLYKWIEKLDLWEVLDATAKQKGFPSNFPAPPRTKLRIVDAVVEAKGSLLAAASALGRTEEALISRITELDFWDEINRSLRSHGHPQIPRKRLERERKGAA